jgi:hypothetical protein
VASFTVRLYVHSLVNDLTRNSLRILLFSDLFWLIFLRPLLLAQL